MSNAEVEMNPVGDAIVGDNNGVIPGPDPLLAFGNVAIVEIGDGTPTPTPTPTPIPLPLGLLGDPRPPGLLRGPDGPNAIGFDAPGRELSLRVLGLDVVGAT